MVDGRSAGFYGIGGGFNFKSGDISGTAAKTADDRQSQGMEYFAQEDVEQEERVNNEYFTDRSAQLRASLSSLAMINFSTIAKSLKKLTEENSSEENSENDAEHQEQEDFEQEDKKSDEDESQNSDEDLNEDIFID